MGLFGKKKKDGAKYGVEYYELYKAGKFQEALELVEKYFDKDSPADWYTKGNALNNLGRIQEALECYEQAVVRVPDYIKAWYRAGHIFFHLEKFDKAGECFATVSNREREQGENEWSTAGYFGFMLCQLNEHRFLEKENTVDKKLQENTDSVVKGTYDILREKEAVPEFTDINEFIDYCSKHIDEIFDEIEPNIVFEVRTR